MDPKNWIGERVEFAVRVTKDPRPVVVPYVLGVANDRNSAESNARHYKDAGFAAEVVQRRVHFGEWEVS